MKVTCDAAKNIKNEQKHGVSLTDAEFIDWDAAWIWQDARHDYGEPRMVALAPIGERLYCVIYVDREDDRRIISLRKANYREAIQYANQN